ncbi:MAG: hypothetical protein U0L76_00970 [Ruminococcus sp.]|nr:hypothetical protein [Ruminococcus sp.]
MKKCFCDKCKCHWFIEENNSNQTARFCTFCGSKIEENPSKSFNSIEAVFSYLISEDGVRVFENTSKVVGYISDYLPSMKIERNLVKIFLDSQTYQYLLNGNNLNVNGREMAHNKLINEYGISREWAERLTQWFLDAFSYSNPINKSEFDCKLDSMLSYSSIKEQTTLFTDTAVSHSFNGFVNNNPVSYQKQFEKVINSKVTGGNDFIAYIDKIGRVTVLGERITPNIAQANYWHDMVSITSCSGRMAGLCVAPGNRVLCTDKAMLNDFIGDFIDIAIGLNHIVGLLKNGTVVCKGSNNYGQCNTNSREWKNIISVVANGNHTVGLKFDGTVVATGGNSRGQLMVSEWNEIIQVSAGLSHTVGLKKNGTVLSTGNDSYYATRVSKWHDITQVSAGTKHTVGLKRDGTVVTTVYPVGHEYLNEVQAWRNILFVFAGDDYTLGVNNYGQILIAGRLNGKEMHINARID